MKHSIEIKKFPEILYENKPLIWDSRQKVEGKEGWAIIFDDEHSNVQGETELKARSGLQLIGKIGSGYKVEVEDPRSFLAESAAKTFNFPSEKLKVFGVTGTNGKTTSVAVLRHLLVDYGFAVCEIGTLGVSIYRGKEIEKFETGFTTPDAPTLQNLFYQLLMQGITHVVMEVSSHAIELKRIAALSFDGVLFTNLTQDHLDFHKTMQRYEKAKTELFSHYLYYEAHPKENVAVVHTKEQPGLRILQAVNENVRKVGFAERKDDFKILRHSIEGTEIELPKLNKKFKTHLVGDFNAENVVGALMLLYEVGYDLKRLLASIEKFHSAPGRLERVGSSRDKKVFVDYAHSPDALEKAIRALKKTAFREELILVFGCGGDRDREKRPLMGRIASSLADRVIITSDNPRSENPQKIIDEIVAGVDSGVMGRYVTTEIDREQAIAQAIASLDSDKVLLIAGKGHEEFQIVGDQKKPFSDREMVLKYLTP